ncbi:MAG: hypothetical protein Ta2E_09400 [Mycoplasmoidaceae bacterium]|nr:MAG: hypothetical protein Ta2E_09400 [Mycoplasmoidaceae bacterium]
MIMNMMQIVLDTLGKIYKRKRGWIDKKETLTERETQNIDRNSGQLAIIQNELEIKEKAYQVNEKIPQ